MFKKISIAVLLSVIISMPAMAQTPPQKSSRNEQIKEYMCKIITMNKIKKIYIPSSIQNKTLEALKSIFAMHKSQKRRDNWGSSIQSLSLQLKNAVYAYINISCDLTAGDIITAQKSLDAVYENYIRYLEFITPSVQSEWSVITVCSDELFSPYNAFFRENKASLSDVWKKASTEEKNVYNSMYRTMIQTSMITCDRKSHKESFNLTEAKKGIINIIDYVKFLQIKYPL